MPHLLLRLLLQTFIVLHHVITSHMPPVVLGTQHLIFPIYTLLYI